MKIIPLTRGKVALVSDRDYPLVRKHKWYAAWNGRHWYARATIENKKVYLHRFLKGRVGFEVDHRNRNGLDNRRRNLRGATSSQNHANARRRVNNLSGHKGVDFHSLTGKWRARVQQNGYQIHLGLFQTKRKAAAAYAKAARFHYKQFARTK